MGTIRNKLFDHAVNLLELFHEIVFGLNTPGGIDNHHIAPVRLGPLDGVIDDGSGIGTLVLADDRNGGAVSTKLELIDSPGAEGVGGGEGDVVSFFRETIGHLRDTGGFPCAIDANDENDGE